MPRATRYLQDGYLYHLTHRCLDGEFFLRFARERDAYREWLRVGARRYGVPVLGYTITSNHVHVVVEATNRYAVADMMKLAAGAVAQSRNRRKTREGSMWEHPYQCTRVQDGRHLLNCLRYIDLNMVRAGKVSHPAQWRWNAYDELTGQRLRYRIIDQERLLCLTGFATLRDFAGFHDARIEESLCQGHLRREAVWTEAVAIGDREFVEAAEQSLSHRQFITRYELALPGSERAWAIRERPASYAADSEGKSAV